MHTGAKCRGPRIGSRPSGENEGCMRSNLLARLLVALALVLAAMVGSIPAGATAFSTDQSDLWWNPDESGWGVQFVQTGSIVFATMYVYGPSGQPIWYIATLEPQPTADTWSGDLYMGTGPWFGTAPFNPASVAGHKVGTMTWTALSTESGVLTYVVDGVPVSKTIYRQTLRYDDFAGLYNGSFYFTRGCGPLVFQGSSTPILVTQGTNRLVVKASFDPRSSPNGIYNYCTFTGDYVQFGHFGRSQGTFDCEDGSHGTHNFTEMTVQTVGWTRLWSALLAGVDDSGCAIGGHLFGTSGPAPAAAAPTCNITPSQTVSAGTSVTLALANCSPGTGLTYSWNQGSLAGAQVSTAATYTTPPLTATTTYFATVSANGSSTTYQTTVSVNPLAPPPKCSITPSQAVDANTSVTLALADCSPGTGLTYSWNHGSPAGPQVSTAATYTTPPLTATTTYFATVSADGRSTTYLSTVSVNPLAPPPKCSITPSQAVDANTSVTLALADCSPGTGLTYSWNHGSPAGPQVSTAATYTTPPLTATTTYFATVSANGRSTTYLSTVSVNPPPLPGSCSAYTGVNLGDLHFDGARVATSGVSGSDVVVGRIVVPSGWAGKVASIAIYEYDDPQYAKKAYLSKSPCDFTTVWPAYNEGNSMSLMVSFETSISNAVRMNAGEFWYLTVKNERLSGAPSCASGSSCNFAITMSVPSF